MSREFPICEPHSTSDQNREKATRRPSPISSSIHSLRCAGKKLLLPVTYMDPQCYCAYAPGSVGCCTIGLGGLVESVLVVVVDAAPSSRLKAMIQVIIGASLLLGTAISPTAGNLGRKKTCCGMRV